MESSPHPSPRRAVLSVSDKRGLEEFARRLHALGFELVSTGGTARALAASGIPVREVADITGFPEMLDGRVKTLHPLLHGGLLGRPRDAAHRAQMQAHGIVPIEVLVVNLYPFEQVAARPGVGLEEVIENIDIGGPAMLRSAAKNHESVAVVTDPADYEVVATELEQGGQVTAATRRSLAQRVFERTAAYDAAIAAELARRGSPAEEFPPRLALQGERSAILRYGENPHQRAALYRDPRARGGIAWARLLQGKELSYNNLVDLDAAWELAAEFPSPAVAIVKHTNPAGCAVAPSLLEAYQQALACDPVSAFGGVIGLNQPLDGAAAAAMAELFLECIAAPGFSPEARAALGGKKNLRLVEVSPAEGGAAFALRSLSGGWVAQERDAREPDPAPGADLGAGWRVVTRRAPTPLEAAGLRFAWRVAKHVKSNAIVLARGREAGGQTLGVGAGQMSRVDAVKVAVMRALLPLAGCVVASDAFFPFADGVRAAAAAGATAVIQPGGSVRDAEVVAAADELGLAMVFTARRHFRH